MKTRDAKEWAKIQEATTKLGMPSPRLQFTWVANEDNWQDKECRYSLVLPLRQHDIRREDENGEQVRSEIFSEISHTLCRGGRHPVYPNGKIDVPFRDGAHARWDSELLNGLPVYVVCGESFMRLPNKSE